MRRRVLYIEDDREVQAFMDAVCRHLGDVELLIANTAREADDRYRFVTRECGATFDLLIVDGQLPDARGWQIINALRAMYGSLPPVLAHPGDLSDALRDTWNKAGVTEILPKPADLDVLVDTINRLAPRGARKESA